MTESAFSITRVVHWHPTFSQFGEIFNHLF